MLVESAVRATLVVAVIALVLWIMRIKTARVRHAVWAGVVVLMLLLPAWVAWGPKAPLPVLPPERTQVAGVLPPPLPAGLAEHSSAESPSPAPSPARQGGGYLAIYLIGAGVLLLRLAIGTFRASRLKSCVAPITVGILRPRILLPESSKHWPQAQLDAVLAHESEHARRRDPLFQWLALLNRAIFWFHPLAWWLERNLAGLAEEACDAAVLAQGHDPREYARHLVALARSVTYAGTRIEVLGMTAAGAGLPRRIRKICSGVPPVRASRARIAAVSAACIAAAISAATASLSHAQSSSPEFEAVSIKPNRSTNPGGFSRLTGGSYSGTNVTLRQVIGLAYSPIQEFSGITGWMGTEHYDIAARAAGNPSQDDLKLMLRSMLADRFKLVAHKETRELPAYALTLARGDGKLGPALKRTEADCSEGKAGKGPGGCGSGRFRVGPGAISAKAATMDALAGELRLSGRPVVNRTGLEGVYDLDLQWSPDDLGANAELFNSIREQLGLKLDSVRAPADVIVIDSAERPSEN